MLAKIKSYFENTEITPISWLIGISGIMMVRFFLESLSNPSSTGFFASDASTLIHYYLFFLAAAMIFMVFLRLIVPSWKKEIPQFVALAMIAIFIAPIVDWMVSGGAGFKMAYIFESPRNLPILFLSFLGSDPSVGITWGIKIEMILIILSAGLFVYFVEKSVMKTFASVIATYTIVFVLFSLPSMIPAIVLGEISQDPLVFFHESAGQSLTVLNNLHSTLQYSSVIRLIEIFFNFIMSKLLFLISATFASIWFYLNSKEKLKAVIKNSRPERVAHYILLIFIGILIALSTFPAVNINWDDWLSVFILCLSFYFSWMFAVCTNDIVDEDIDAISNANRPLVAASLTKEDMKQASVIFLFAALISGFLAGYTAFFFVLTFTALYYIYSIPPTRFKLIPFFSSFLISLCCLLAVLAGFFLISPDKHASVFPDRLIAGIVLIFFFGSHIRDIKDIKGDKLAKVKTIPVLFGDTWGPRIVGLFVSVAFLLLPIFLKTHILFISAIPAAIISFYFINRVPYKEKYIFFTYFIFVILSLLLFLL